MAKDNAQNEWTKNVTANLLFKNFNELLNI